MSTLRALLAQERRRQRRRLAIAAAAAAACAAAAVGLLSLSGWFITGAALAGVSGTTMAGAFNYLLPSACIRLLAITRTGCRYAERISGHDAALRTLARVRPTLFTALAASPPAASLAMTTGEAVARMTQDVAEVEAGFVRRPAIWGVGAALVAGAVLVLPAGTPVTAAALAVAGALSLLARGLAASQAAHGAAVAAENGALKQELAALLAATQELRSYQLEAWAADHVAARSRTLLAAQRRAAAGGAWFEPLQAAFGGVAAMLVLALAEAASLPVAALAGLGTVAMMEGVSAYLRGLSRTGQLGAAERRLDSMLDTRQSDDAFEPAPLTPFAIELPDLGIRLVPGTVVGIAGPSGCGKTTLLETFIGLRHGAAWPARVAGRDMAKLSPKQLRPVFSLAEQDASLLAGTVRENLLLGDPAANEADLWAALHDAALDRRIAALPGGLDCWIGEGGLRLSGGERRRLSLARALLRDAPWLLLDEPTEGLDAQTEAVVVARLRDRLAERGQGAIIVSHREAPLGLCRNVLHLSNYTASRSFPPSPFDGVTAWTSFQGSREGDGDLFPLGRD